MSAMPKKIHHSAIVTNEVEKSLLFWTEGLGLSILMDEKFDGDWPKLFGATSTRLRSLFLGSPDDPHCGIVELVELGRLDAEEDAVIQGQVEIGPPGASPMPGFLLLSLHADLAEVLPRLAALGLGGEPRVAEVAPGVRLCVVTDPNGVVVELMDGASEPVAGPT